MLEESATSVWVLKAIMISLEILLRSSARMEVRYAFAPCFCRNINSILREIPSSIPFKASLDVLDIN